LQLAEVELRVHFIIWLEVIQMPNSFDEKSKQHSQIVANLQVYDCLSLELWYWFWTSATFQTLSLWTSQWGGISGFKFSWVLMQTWSQKACLV
jgi:hypothetical protein